MVVHTILKKLTRLFLILFALSDVLLASDKVPKILRVGVAPLQLAGSSDDTTYQEFFSQHQQDFFSAVEQTKRFRLINSDLVAKLWASGNGRRQLTSQYEMDGLLRMKISNTGETIHFVTEILSPELKTYLYESDAMSLENLKDKKAVKDFIEKLVFRLVNRLPVDGFIIATQGPYATIGAGADQGVSEGAKFEVYRSSVESLHPATGAWLTFNSNRVGRVKAVDVKKSTTIAKIEDQVYENSILPGDGIKIPEIPSRKMFRVSESDESAIQESTIAEPLYSDPSKTPSRGKSPTAGKAESDPEEPNQTPLQTPIESQTENDSSKQSNSPEHIEKVDVSDGESLSWARFRKQHKDYAESYKLFGGTYDFSISGPDFDGSSKWPIWLITDFGILLSKKPVEGMTVDYGAEIFLGGNFFGFKIFAQPTWTLSPSVMPTELNTFRAGVVGDFSTRNVSGSDFGGTDILKFGPFAGVSGLLKQVPYGLNWSIDASLPLFGFGRVGYNGSKQQATSVSGLGWKLQGLLAEPIDDIQYGFIIDYGNDFYKTSDGSIGERYMKLQLQAQLKW